MTTELIQFEGGDILANLDERTITGLLLPYNEIGSTNIGRFAVEAAAISIPKDPAVIGLNTDHERSEPVGRAIKLWEQPQGIMATFKIADTPEGDAALLDATTAAGKRRKLSAEFHAVIKAGKAIGGRLWGAALVNQGAFPSAQVLAMDTPAEDAAHLELQVDVLPDHITATTPAGESADYTPDAAPAEETLERESTVTATAEAPATAPASIPPTQTAGAPVLATVNAETVGFTQPRPVSLNQVVLAMAAVKANPSDYQAKEVLANLVDVNMTGTDALPAADVLRPNWLGELYSGIPYVREYITLGKLGTGISAAGKRGFRAKRGTVGSPITGPAGTPNQGTWAGNQAVINSYNGFTEVASSSLRRFAVGQDLGREFYDLPGGAEAVEAFLRLTVEDHAFWSDSNALNDINAAAGAAIAPVTYPSNYPAALGMLIQGILRIKSRKADGRRDVPTFAIANDVAYSALAYAAGGEVNLPAFISIALSTNSTGTIDGSVQVVQGDTGITGTASVIVGSQNCIEFDELAGGPLILNALDITNGGIDRGVHGYLQTFVPRVEGFTRIGVPDAFPLSTAVTVGRIFVVSAVQYRVTVAGTTAGANPTAPAVGATVVSGGATLLRLV